MSMEDALAARTPETNQPSGVTHLSRQDLDRLTNYKWRYSLESHGFSTEQATRLLFIKWLHRRGLLQS
jgi:hypothetical protein